MQLTDNPLKNLNFGSKAGRRGFNNGRGVFSSDSVPKKSPDSFFPIFLFSQKSPPYEKNETCQGKNAQHIRHPVNRLFGNAVFIDFANPVLAGKTYLIIESQNNGTVRTFFC